VTASAPIGLTAVVTVGVYIPALHRGCGQLTAVHPVKQLPQGWSLAGLCLVMGRLIIIIIIIIIIIECLSKRACTYVELELELYFNTYILEVTMLLD